MITVRSATENDLQQTLDIYNVFIAEENNKIVGFSTFGQFRNWQAYHYSVENSVYVKADCRGKGIGKLLLQPLINAAKEMQLHTIIAGIVADNESSLIL